MVNIDPTTPQLKALKKWIDAFDSLDASKIGPVLSNNYIHETFPKSIGLPDETKEEHIKRYKETLPAMRKIDITVHEVIEAPGKVVFHATTKCETTFGPIDNDSVFIVSLVEEDGELKVLRSKEFSDPKQYGNFYGGKAAAEKAAVS